MGEITQILDGWSEGSGDALGKLMPLVYHDLRRLAQHCLHGEEELSLQATELVHEVYCILARQGRMKWINREQFFSIAARLMRRLIVDAARERHAVKRGGAWVRVSDARLADVPATEASMTEEEMRRLDSALERLQEHDPQKAGVVVLRFFGDLDVRETARAMGVSESTVKREWRLARLWLHREIRG